VNVILLRALYFSSSIVCFRERIEGLEILDVRGHMIDRRALLVLRVNRWSSSGGRRKGVCEVLSEACVVGEGGCWTAKGGEGISLAQV
jgi:hypothetical protein